MFEIGSDICGFRINKFTDVPDVNGRLWYMTYEQNGAELIWLERKDDVKTFAIAFKTLPEDNTGVAHILEHSVLSGSEKYPVKSPFSELRKSSLRVFMNAMTARDKTYYPFSTRNNQDFLNLAEVYLDAVFHPAAIKSPMAFQQEGWHYEINQKGFLQYNGVVYNEMKGVFADPEQTASREIMHYLYPDTVYGNDSGGKPDSIPDLTFEKFCAFYQKYYHPTNARIFLDGNVDIFAILRKLDSCLKDFSQGEVIPPISEQNPVYQAKTIPYASTDCRRKTVLADAWSVGTFHDPVHVAALDILSDYLAGTNESPLKKALLSQELCEDLKLWIYSYQQIPMILLIRNTTDEQAAVCRNVVRQTLNDLLAEGLDNSRLTALINQYEFAVRDINGTRPRGISYFSMAISHWLYGGDPADVFAISNICNKLRDGIKQGLFEKIIQENILNNKHHAELTFSPDKNYGIKQQQQTEEKLLKYRSGLSESEFSALERNIAVLKEYQNHSDSFADKEKIPAIKIVDIPEKKSLPEHNIEVNDDVTIIRTRPTSDGVVYISVYFSLDGLSKDELVLMSLFAYLHGKLSTVKHDALTLHTLISANIGRMEFSTVATERGNYLRVKIAVLSSNDIQAIKLLQEVIYETVYDDVPSIENIYRQRLLLSERYAVTQGHNFASSYAAKACSYCYASHDIFHGYTQLRRLQNLSMDDSYINFCNQAAEKVFMRKDAIISFTDNISNDAQQMLFNMLKTADETINIKRKISLETPLYEGLQLDCDIGFAGLAAILPDNDAYQGSMYVAAKILSLEYLHKELREIGGAYGAVAAIRSNRLISAYTYRDPTPVASIAKMQNMGHTLLNFSRTEKNLDRYITATIAGIDPYLSSDAEASYPVNLFLKMRTQADEDVLWQQILHTSYEDIKRCAFIIQEQMAKSYPFVVGGIKQLSGLPAEKITMLHPII